MPISQCHMPTNAQDLTGMILLKSKALEALVPLTRFLQHHLSTPALLKICCWHSVCTCRSWLKYFLLLATVLITFWVVAEMDTNNTQTTWHLQEWHME